MSRAPAAGLLAILGGLVVAPPAEAAIFGVPTNLSIDGQVCIGASNPVPSCAAASSNPPGFFVLHGTGDGANGDQVHQIRFFIEVTGPTLDIKVFDAGRNGSRDDSETGIDINYELFDPTAASVAFENIGGDIAATDNRLARFQNGSFVAANLGAAFAVNPGLYEFRVTVTGGTASLRHAFGVDIRDGSGNHYNVFTVGDTTAPDTAFVAGAWNNGTPPANIVQPMPLYPYVNRGCSLQASNYHLEAASAAGAGSSIVFTDALGVARVLTSSDTGATNDAVTIEDVSTTNLDSTNYGLWPLTNGVGTQQNIVDWRFADYQAWATAPGAGAPGDPTSPLRMYLPNGYAPVTGNPNATAPVEPILQSAFRHVSGPNPGQPGTATRYEITSSLFNPGPGSISNVVLRVPLAALTTLVAGTAAATIDGVTATCTEAGGVPGVVGAEVRCTFTAAVAVGSVASLLIRVDHTPAAAGYFDLTAAPTPALTGTLYATYTPASSSVTFPRSETIGPLCQLRSYATNRVDLSVVKTDLTDPVAAGANITYTITVSNLTAGVAAPSVSLEDTLPANTTFVSLAVPGGWTCPVLPPAGATGDIACTNPSLAGGASSIFTLVVRVGPGVAAGTLVSNTATVTSGGVETAAGNNTSTQITTIQVQADLSLTKTDAPDPVLAGADITYVLAVTNSGPSNNTVTLDETIPANTTFRSVSFPSGWSCPIQPAVGGTGAVQCTVASLAAGATARLTLVVRVNAGVAAGTLIINSGTIPTGATDPNPANNTAIATTTVGSLPAAPLCATGATGPGGTLSGIINTYYPATATAAAGATSITLGASRGAATTISPGDLVLVIQMQDAAIDSSNDERYGDGTGTAGNTTGNGSGSTALNNVGRYQYVVATNAVGAAGGTLNIATALANTYTNAAATATQGQRGFQVVRVPQYTTATLGPTLTAAAWNGATGGILAFDTTGNLALGTTTVSVSGLGFRAGLGRALAGGAGTDTDYRNPAANNVHGSKGEGIAGTPRFLWSAAGGALDTGIDGYPNGSSARGAPGNAGGGGTDGNTAANDQNSGGGGGGNAGAGGRGGNAWQSQEVTGGFGGAAFTSAVNRLILGGGGGAGSRNNSSADQSSGGAGGGLVMIRASSASGTGTITANGDTGLAPLNDGGGGGGAGGSVMFLVNNGGLGGLTVNATGGRGTDAWPLQAPNGTPGERHGPGGGGGGGLILLSATPLATSVVAGQNGITTTANDAYGAQPGGVGSVTIDTNADGTEPASCPGPDLSITKTDNPDPVFVGAPLTYTIVATNAFQTATVVTVTDTLPASVTFASVSSTRGTCSFASPTVTCSLGTLLSGESATITIIVVPANATSPILNAATVAAAEVELTLANNSASASTTVNPSADLAVTKSGLPDPVSAGADVTWTIVVQNLGPSAAANPTLAEATPTNTTFQSIATAAAGWTCPTTPAVGGTGAVSCTGPASFASGASATFTFVVRVNAGTAPGSVLTNTATVASTTADPNPSNNTDSASVTVSPPVALLTRAALRGLRVDPRGQVSFATSTQRGTLSFNLLASDDPRGRDGLVLLNAEPVRAVLPDSQAPLLYEVQTAPISARYLFIEETERGGRRHLLGPFPVGDLRLARAYDRVAQRLRAAGEKEGVSAGAQRVRGLAPAAQRREQRAPRLGEERGRALPRPALPVPAVRSGIKVEIVEPGVVRLSRAELRAHGLPAGQQLRRILVSQQGQPVAAQVENEGAPEEALVFRAVPLSTTYTGRNVYLLTWNGLPTLRVPLTFEEAPPATGVTRVSKRLVYAPDATGTDPWVWDALFSDGTTWPESAWDPAAGTFDLPGLLADSAPFRLRVVGASEHRHAVEAWLNGQWLGRVTFEGRDAGVLEGGVSGLLETGNQLSLSYSTEDASPDGMLLLAHLDLQASLPTKDAAAVVELGAFAPAVRVKGAQYLVVTHADFLPAARRLAALKQKEGWRTTVVDVARAYDRFSAGVVEAQAVRALIAETASAGSLRHVLLLGDDTYDPRGFSGLGEVSYVPSLYAHDGAYGRVPSENRYADGNGDGRPDVAMGRLPARTPAEAEALVTKIAQQAQALQRSAGRQLFAVDNPTLGAPSFKDEATVAAAVFASGSAVTWADVGEGIENARAALAAGVAQGARVVHYFGHGGPETWADEQLLAVEDVASLTGPGSVFLTWACQVQDYQYIFGRSVNEALLLKPQGGALATFGPAGITDLSAQAAFYERLYDVLLRRGLTLGEAIREAKTAALLTDPRVRPVIEGFNLLGDPALVLDPAPRKARR